MSIRPIDMQVLIPKATEVGKQQNILAQQSMLEQEQVAEQMQRMAEARQQQVQGLNKGEGGKVKRDESRDKRNRHGNYETSSRQNDSPVQDNLDEVEMTQDPIRGHVVDIKT